MNEQIFFLNIRLQHPTTNKHSFIHSIQPSILKLYIHSECGKMYMSHHIAFICFCRFLYNFLFWLTTTSHLLGFFFVDATHKCCLVFGWVNEFFYKNFISFIYLCICVSLLLNNIVDTYVYREIHTYICMYVSLEILIFIYRKRTIPPNFFYIIL